jgi:hypothetical protein
MSNDRPYKEYNLESGKILEIHHDESPESPREWDNLGTVWCSHKRYSLSDKHAPKIDTDDHDGWDAVKEHLIEEEGAVVILPIYMYDHSGITISTKPFGDRWDSGQVGFIYCTGAKIKDEYRGKRITKRIKEKIETYLKGEIETYDQYVTGDVYGFKLMRVVDILTDEREEEHACWGFFGDDFQKNGILDHLGKNDVILKER